MNPIIQLALIISMWGIQIFMYTRNSAWFWGLVKPSSYPKERNLECIGATLVIDKLVSASLVFLSGYQGNMILVNETLIFILNIFMFGFHEMLIAAIITSVYLVCSLYTLVIYFNYNVISGMLMIPNSIWSAYAAYSGFYMAYMNRVIPTRKFHQDIV